MPSKPSILGPVERPVAGGVVVPAQMGGGIPSNAFQGTPPHNIPTRRNRPPAIGTNQSPVVPITPGPPGLPTRTRVAGDRLNAIFDKHHYIEIGNLEGVAVALNASGMVLPRADTFRAMLAIRCVGANPVCIAFGSDATLSSVYRLTQNQIFLWDSSVPQNDVFALAETGASTISIAFGNAYY